MTTGAGIIHKKAMETAMRYVVGTPERGLLLKPIGEWDGRKDYEFVISGCSDSDKFGIKANKTPRTPAPEGQVL